jgi:hypothetical protein
MDPFSIVASSTGIIGFAIQASTSLYSLIDGTLDAPKEVTAASREAKAFASVLTSLQGLIAEGKVREDAIVLLRGPLDNCVNTLTALSLKIQPHIKPTGDAKKSKWRGLTWYLKREETRELCSRLSQSNVTLNTAISIMNTCVLLQSHGKYPTLLY